jgi:hypothetical protein
MVNKLHINILRNAEWVQYMSSTCNILDRFGVDRENLEYLYGLLAELLKTAETAMAIERNNEKIRAKNDADRYRDRLHRKIFNYVKSILYDELDPRFDDAQSVMRVMKEVGNPTQLAENAESAMLTALVNRLEPYKTQVAAIGAKEMLEALATANNRFITLEIEARDITATQKMDKGPSMVTIRKQGDATYRHIVDAINGYANLPAKKEEYRELITEMNVLVTKYDQLLMSRKKSKKEDSESNS